MGTIDPGFSRQDDLQPLLEHAFFLQLPDEGHPFFFELGTKQRFIRGSGGCALGRMGNDGQLSLRTPENKRATEAARFSQCLFRWKTGAI
jgi:hypothetical protein